MTREEWARQFLKGVGAPVSKRNLITVVSWIQAEGGSAKWNPLNSTHDAPGATTYNWAGVKNYPDSATGLSATVTTLNYGADRNIYGYRKIRHRLRQNNGSFSTLRAVEKSEWGTGGLALACLPFVKRSWDYYSRIPISS